MKNTIHISRITGVALILIASAFLHAEEPESPKDWVVTEDPQLEFTVRGYPDTIYFGDTIYLICTYKNVGEQVIDDVPMYLGCAIEFIDGNIEISPGFSKENIRSKWQHWPPPGKPLHPGESRVMCVRPVGVPHLKDMDEPFWKDMMKRSRNSDRELTLQMTTKVSSERYISLERMLTHSIKFRPRPEAEMALLDSWFMDCKNNNLSVDPFDLSYSKSVENRIEINGGRFHPRHFIILGDYGLPPMYLCPETWQSWKELEESITPSTMRDEIRLTRIHIQYYDTQDEKVLDELKEWFAGMNEVQRGVMAKSVLGRALSFPDVRMLPLCGKFYLAVREYGIAYESGLDVIAMKGLRWIE